MPKNNQPFDGRVSKQNQQGSQKTVLPNKSVELRHLSDALLLKILPTGCSIEWNSNIAPDGWFIEDGIVLKQAEYPELFAEIGTIWNTGGEAGDEFRIPDSRGRSSIGAGTGAGLSARTLAQIGGEENHQLIIGEIPSHNHGGGVHGHGNTGGASSANFTARAVDNVNVSAGDRDLVIPNEENSGSGTISNRTMTHDHVHGISNSGTIISSQGSNSVHNTMHPYNVKNKIIKY